LKRRAVAMPLSLIASAIVLTACVDIPTSADEVLSFQFVPLPSPGVVLGDSLRDSLGVVTPVRVRGFNYQGDTIETVDVRFLAVDRGVQVDSVTGIVTGDSIRPAARIQAMVNGLSGFANLAVTYRPDSVTGSNARDSLSYSLTDSTQNTSAAIGVRVLHGALGDTSVAAWRVSFAITSVADTALAHLVDDNGKLSTADTTDASGIGARRLRIDVRNLVTPIDSVIVLAFVKYRGVNVRGSPVQLVLKVKPK
jgi:hypothetical protein